MYFKFMLGEKLVVESLRKIGTVIKRSYEETQLKDSVKTVVKYTLDFGGYQQQWFTKEQLTSAQSYFCGDYKFEERFEREFLNLLIDSNLVNKSFDNIELLQQEKLKYAKGGM